MTNEEFVRIASKVWDYHRWTDFQIEKLRRFIELIEKEKFCTEEIRQKEKFNLLSKTCTI